MSEKKTKSIIFVQNGESRSNGKTLSDYGQIQMDQTAKKLDALFENRETYVLGGYKGKNIAIFAPIEQGPALQSAIILENEFKTNKVILSRSLNNESGNYARFCLQAQELSENVECIVLSLDKKSFDQFSFFSGGESDDQYQTTHGDVYVYDFSDNWKNLKPLALDGQKPVHVHHSKMINV